VSRTAESKIPELIIRNCLRVRDGEMVHICSWPHTTDLASKLAVQCFINGAVPLITLMTDELLEETLTRAPLKSIRTVPEHQVAIANSVDAYIHISGPADPTVMGRVPGDRYRAFVEAGSKIGEALRRRRVREVNVHLGKITRERAERYNLDYPAWREVVEDSLLVDYEEIRALGESLSERLSKGGEVHLSTDQGTDLRFKVDGSTIRLDDGVVSDDDVSRGFLSTNLPAGFLEAAPFDGSGDGAVIFDAPQLRVGKIIEGARWVFSQGKLTSITAERNEEVLRRMIDTRCPGGAVLSSLMMGLNPRMKPGFLFDEMCRGTVSVAVGAEKGVGAVTGVLHHPTLYIGGKKIIDGGAIAS